MIESIIREEIFGATYFCAKTGNRYYINEKEYFDIITKGKFPHDFKNEDITDISHMKIIPIDRNDKNILKFAFTDVAFIETTRKCNLHCLHCLNDSGSILNNEMSYEEIMNSILKLCNAGVFEIRFTGGEPLLNPGIFDFIKLCTENNVITSLGTNGTLITEQIAEKLKYVGLKKCVISLDGTEKVHDKIRGKGSFSKSLNAIYLLRNVGINVRVNSVLMNSNIEDIIELAKFLNNEHINLYIRRFIESGRGRNLNNQSLSIEQYNYVKDSLKEELNGKYIDGHYLKSSDMLKNFRIDLPFIVTGCRAGERSFYIASNGDMYPCGFLASLGFESLANIRDYKELRSYWNMLQADENLTELRNNMVRVNKKNVTCMAYVYDLKNRR